MKVSELLKVLDDLDSQKVWLFTTDNFSVLFPKESRQSLAVSLARQVEAGILVKIKKGLYANERALSAPTDRLPALVPYLRPGEINYVSLESRLSDLGVISQMPIDCLTMMTTGRSQVFDTKYGRIEFTHTSRDPEVILSSISPSGGNGLYVASVKLAYLDLRRTGRSTDLVNNELLNELMAEEHSTGDAE